MADRQPSAVDDICAGLFAALAQVVEQQHGGRQQSWHQGFKASIGGEVAEAVSVLALYGMKPEAFEVAVGRQVEQGHDDHHLAQCAPGLADAFSCGGDKAMSFPFLAEAAKIVETAEERYGRCVHGRDPRIVVVNNP